MSEPTAIPADPKHMPFVAASVRYGLSVTALNRMVQRSTLVGYKPLPLGRVLLAAEERDQLISGSAVTGPSLTPAPSLGPRTSIP